MGCGTASAHHKFGADLFFGKKLSVNDRVSCSSCHQPGKAFTDGRRLAVGVHGHVGDHNTPVIFNRDASTRQFADGRASSLEAQVKHPFDSPDELGLPLNEAVKKLRLILGRLFEPLSAAKLTQVTWRSRLRVPTQFSLSGVAV